MQKTIEFISDGNVAEFVEVVEYNGRVKLKEPQYIYRYTVSSTKEGLRIGFTATQLSEMIKDKIIKNVSKI